MKVTTKDLPKSQVELNIELSVDEFKPHLIKASQKIAQEIKIDGFRPGKAPYELIKAKIGEMTILEEGARIAIAKIIDETISSNIKKQPIGQPQISITKLAPNNPLEVKIIVSLLPDLKLGIYKDLKIKKTTAKVDPKEADVTLNQLVEMRVVEKISDSEAKDGNKVLLDINIFLDKVPIEGGQGKGTTIIIGKNYIVPGFDKQLIGAKKGDTKTFKLPYPENHHMKNLAGKMVDFKVNINEVYERELPKLDKEFAKNFNLNSIEELKTNILKSIEQEKQRDLDQKSEIEILEKIMDKSKFDDMPDDLVNHESELMMKEFENKVTKEGGKLEDYLLSIKKTRDQILLDMLPQAVKRVKSALLVQKIAEEEKISTTKEEIEAKKQELLKQYKGYEKVEERVNAPEYTSHLRSILVNQKVMEKLRKWNLV